MLNVRRLQIIMSTIWENTTALEMLNLTKNDSLLLKKMLDDEVDRSRSSHCEECKWIIQDLAVGYAKSYHGCLAMLVCLFGTVANILNIIVLTRKDMVCAPINRILTALAVADMCVMVEYIPFAYYYHIELPEKMNFTYDAAIFILFHIHFTQVFHTISICLTLTLAIWRYFAIAYPEKNHILCSESRCTLAITLSYLLPVLLCSPTYFTIKITTTTVTEDNKDIVLYHTSVSEKFLVFNIWAYAVMIKLLPCCILTVITSWLIKTLFEAKKRKQILRGYDYYPPAGNKKDKDVSKRKPSKAERRADRTTKMLIAVLLLFLITEFPQGIFALLIGMRGKCFFMKCYQKYGEIMDMLALCNGAINFILYCCMNRMFRMTFSQLFKQKILARLSQPSHSDMHTTIKHTLGKGPLGDDDGGREKACSRRASPGQGLIAKNNDHLESFLLFGEAPKNKSGSLLSKWSLKQSNCVCLLNKSGAVSTV